MDQQWPPRLASPLMNDRDRYAPHAVAKLVDDGRTIRVEKVGSTVSVDTYSRQGKHRIYVTDPVAIRNFALVILKALPPEPGPPDTTEYIEVGGQRMTPAQYHAARYPLLHPGPEAA